METKVPGGRIGIAPHSLRAVTLDDLEWAAATWRGQPAHIHVSEQTREVDDCLAAHGRRPIDLLMDTVEVDEHWCLVHATHADAGERARIAKAKAVVGLCPITEANLGDGLFDVPDFLAHGGRFGVGSDSNVRISAADELRTLEYGQRLIHRQRNVLGDAADRPAAACSKPRSPAAHKPSGATDDASSRWTPPDHPRRRHPRSLAVRRRQHGHRLGRARRHAAGRAWPAPRPRPHRRALPQDALPPARLTGLPDCHRLPSAVAVFRCRRANVFSRFCQTARTPLPSRAKHTIREDPWVASAWRFCKNRASWRHPAPRHAEHLFWAMAAIRSLTKPLNLQTLA